MKFIIGPSGKVLKEIEANCAVKVKIPRGEDWNGSIIVSGDFEGVAMARDKILSIVQERANKATAQIEIERTLAAFLWDEELSGITQQQLTESFPNVKVNLVKTGEGAHLNLMGDRTQIEAIQTIISQSLIRLRSSIKSVNTFVPKALHRLLIGPKGAVLHQLEEETGCGISIPSAKDEPENQQVTIFGPEDKLLKGLSALMEKTKGLASEKVSIPEIQFKLIQNSQKYRNELKSFDSEVSLHFNNQNCSIEVDGRKENVLAFIGHLQELLTNLSGYKIKENLEVDQEYLKHVIGRKGQNLQQIQKEFNVEIVIEDEIVCFIGKTKESVQKAKEHVNGILSSVVDMLTLTARIDPKYHGMLIGSKGSNLATYHEKYPSVMINFSSAENSDLVSFKGPRAEVEPCHAEMMAQADSIRHEMIMNSYTQTITLSEPVKSSRDCAFLTNFSRQQDCKLIINETNTLLTLQGLKKNVDSTLPLLKEQLQLIQDRDSLTFSVDPQYHGILIGTEGRNLKHLVQKYSVKIDFPKNNNKDATNDSEESIEDVNSNVSANTSADASIIKVTGPKSNISKARDELLDLLKYHLEHDNQEVIKVPSKAVPFIIGKNGSVIDNIKLETDCKLDILSGESDDEVKSIKLSGTKESIKSAKALINDLVKDFLEQAERCIKYPASLLSVFKREYRKITTKYSAHVNFFTLSRESLIRIKGKKEFVESAAAELENLVKSIENGELVQLELMVSSRSHGKILGVAGATIKELMNEFDCDIQVPKHGQSGPVIIIGPTASVQDCSTKIRSLCTEERLFKFPTVSLKTAVLAKLKESDAIQWKPHQNGIVLVGEIDQIEGFKKLLQEEIDELTSKDQ